MYLLSGLCTRINNSGFGLGLKNNLVIELACYGLLDISITVITIFDGVYKKKK